MTKPQVRPIHIQDLPEVFRMMQDLAFSQSGVNQLTLTYALFERLYRQSFFNVLVAISEEKLIGYLLYYPVVSTWKGLQWYIEDLYVEPNHRRNKIGEELLKNLKTHSNTTAIPIEAIRLSCFDWNTEALRFYQHNGFSVQKDLHALHLSL